MKTTQCLTHSVAILALLILCVENSLASYSLTTGQCENAIKNIGSLLKIARSDRLIKNTFVSPRCEVRRMLELNGDKTTAFMLRKIEVAKRRRWTGNYFFYSDQDCTHATYGVLLQGRLRFKTDKLTLNITSVKIAVYSLEIEKNLIAKYNASCAGQMIQTGSSTPAVYTADGKDFSKDACFKAIGLAQIEFTDLIFETKEPSGKSKTEELLQRKAPEQYQWPLVLHDSPACLTCSKVTLAILKYPPTLYTRNSTSLNGVWATFRCQQEMDGLHFVRIDKYDGNTFEVALYSMEYGGTQLCSNPLYELRISGTFRKVGDAVKVPGGVVYENLVTRAHLTPYNKLWADIFNLGDGKDVCGKKTWEAGVTQDIVPTKGCFYIGYEVDPIKPVISVIRTVRDESRNELFFGGPTGYRFLFQDCSTFPIEMTTTPGPSSTMSTVQPSTSTEEDETTDDQVDLEVEVVVNDIQREKPTDKSTSLTAVARTILGCLLLYLQAGRLV